MVRRVSDEGVDLRMLGPLEAWRGGQQLSLGGRRQRAVLACLLVEPNTAVSSDRIIDAIWGERPPAGALTSLQTYVFHLREALEPGRARGSPGRLIVTVPGGYRLDAADGTIDAVRFEELVEAGRQALQGDPAGAAALLAESLGLWRGDVLADLSDLEVVVPAAARLEGVRLAATESWVEAQLRLGHHDDVLPRLGALVARHPLREHLRALQMGALYRAGRQSEALEAFRDLRRVLDDELGVEPSAEVRTLHERILRQDPTLDVVAPPEPEAPAEAVARSGPASGEQDVAALKGRRAQWRGRLTRRGVASVAAVVVVALGLLSATLLVVGRARPPTPLPPNSVGQLAKTGLVGDAVSLKTNPVALAYGAGSVWVVNQTEDSLSRVDPGDHKVTQTVTQIGGGPQAVATSGDDVWVANLSGGTVARVNAVANRVVKRVAVGSQPSAVVAGPSGVWVANSGDNTVQRVDPATNVADPAIPVGDGPDGLLLDGSDLWVANGRNGTVTILDTRTGQRVAADVDVGSGPIGLAATETDVWVTNQLSRTVSRVPRSDHRATEITVDDGPTGVVVVSGTVWVGNIYSGSMSMIDPGTNAVTKVDLGSSPRALTLVDGDVWGVGGPYANAEHVGGKLTVAGVAGDYLRTLDPAGAYSVFAVEFLRPVYDGLVTFRYAGGLASTTLVPDLAVSIPRPTDSGTTYIFTVRSGIRYSNGATLTASDVVRGLRRALGDDQGNPEAFTGIVGASSCMKAPDTCDLSRGAVADDATGRVTFHLSAPDPDFVDRLALVLVPVPEGTPTHDVGAAALPSTGPYQVSRVDPDGTVTLTRNPYFVAWSVAAQPAGYPDVITRVATDSLEAASDAVVSGRADVAEVPLSRYALLSSIPARVHSTALMNTDFVYPNVTLPPFDDPAVRRALNYAIDRRRVVELFGGAELLTPGCQLLPAQLAAHRPYCPYQSGPADGPYSGPDLTKAQALVAASPRAHTPVVVHANPHGAYEGALPDYVAEVLRSLGFPTTVEHIPAAVVADPTFPERRKTYQLMTNWGWVADYPKAGTFYEGDVACSPGNLDFYCNPELDAAADHARQLEITDPNAALAAWAEVDKRVTDAAPFVALGTHADPWVVSTRVGNYSSSTFWGPLFSQLWVQ